MTNPTSMPSYLPTGQTGYLKGDGTWGEPVSTQGESLPAGVMMAYGGSAAPTGWVLCDGASYATSGQPSLFAAIGYAYGGAGANFSVPDLRSRFPLGRTAQALGTSGGALNHIHAGPSGHSAHVVTQPSAHVVTQPGAHASHVVTQPGAHSAHVVTQPSVHSAHAALATHAHELPFTKVAGGTGVLRMLAGSIFGTGTSRAPESVSAAPTANTTAAAVALSQGVTGGTPDAHSAHAGGAVDAHSAHSGGAVDAHSVHSGAGVDAHAGTGVDAHSAHGSTGTADPPYLVCNWLIKT